MGPRQEERELNSDITLLFQEVKELQTDLYIAGEKEASTEQHSGSGNKLPLHKYVQVGYICAFGVVVSVVGGTSCAQALGGIIPPFELSAMRYISQFTVAFPLVVINNVSVVPPRRHIPWVAVSCVLSSVYNVLFYTASVYLPIGTMGGAEQSLILIIVSVIGSILVLDCKLHITVAVILCSIGVILVSQPEFIFRGTISEVGFPYKPICGKRERSIADNTSYSDAVSLWTEVTIAANLNDKVTDPEINESTNERVGYILISSAAVVTAITYFVINKRLFDVSPFVSSFWLSTSGSIMNTIPSLIFEQIVLPSASECWLLLLGHVYGAAFASICTSISLRIISPVECTLIFCLQGLCFFVAQYTFMKSINPGRHNAVEIVGAVFMIVGSCVNPLYKLYIQTWKKKEEELERLLGDEE